MNTSNVLRLYERLPQTFESNTCGFLITLFSFSVLVCPGNKQLYANTSSKTIQSFNFPFSYLSNIQCTWRITAPANFVVKIKFRVINLEYCSSACSCDFVEVFDYNNTAAECLGKRGRGNPKYVSTGRSMIVNFRSNFFVAGQGFEASYWTVKGERKGKNKDVT